MEVRKEKFLESIDDGNHLNSKTKEAYWDFFEEKCEKNIQKFYQDCNLLMPDAEGLHLYVRFSLRKSKIVEEGEKKADSALVKPSASNEKESSKILPIDEEISHEPTTSWGSNDDVKGK